MAYTQFEDLLKRLGEAAHAVNAFTSESVQRAALDALLAEFRTIGGAAHGPDRLLPVAPTDGPPSVGKPRGASAADGSDPDSRIFGLQCGFLDMQSRLAGQQHELFVLLRQIRAGALTGDDAQRANVDLQSALQRQQQTLQMLSNVSKLINDTAMAVIRKIGG